MKLIFEKSVAGRYGVRPPNKDVPATAALPSSLLRPEAAALPELSELDVVRHFTELSRRNFGVDTGFYPLGSCTMKYNPKAAEAVAHDRNFAAAHPMLARIAGGEKLVQGCLEVVHSADLLLREITGMSAFTTQPMAGANGELTGLLIIAAYHRHKGNKKKVILIPDNAHGTNPASASLAGFEIKTIPSDSTGRMDSAALEAALDDNVAGMMLTSPNTLGLFNPRIHKIADMIHKIDGLMYYDGANLNALLGFCRPGDFGFDVLHLNLHKTFATPHGGGGPGSGPVGVVEKLAPYLPAPLVAKDADGLYRLDDKRPLSIGPIAPLLGNFGIVLRAYLYMLMQGRDGMTAISENAVLNANYVMAALKPYYDLPYDTLCKHECVFSASRQAANGVHALDIAKALIDRGFHPMTIYFPLIVHEAMMIEPTETESKEMLDEFIAAMIQIAELAKTNPQEITSCPKTTPIGRLDETRAARQPDLACLK